MHNKKMLVLITVILLLVLTVSFAMMACEKKDDGGKTDSGDIPDPGPDPGPDPDPEEPELPDYAYEAKDAIEYIAQSASGKYASIVMSGGVELNGKKYVLDAKANISQDTTEMAVKIIEEATKKVSAAVYVVDSKLYVQAEDGTIYHISEINTDYVLSIIDKLPATLKQLILDALKDFGDLPLDSIIELVLPSLLVYGQDNYTYEGEGADLLETFDIKLTPYTFLNSIKGILDTFLKGSDIDLSFISDIVALIPNFDGELKATVKGGVLEDIALNFYNREGENSGSTMIGIDSSIEFGDKGVDLQIPENLKDYKEFSLTNINADFTLDIDTGEEGLDLGALIDTFLNKQILGEGVLVLKAGIDYKLNAKVNLDANLDGKAEDNNLIALTLTAGDKQFAEMYYYEGKFYINVENQIKVAVEFDLASQINNLVDMITNAIDGLFGTEFKSASADSIASISLNENGDVIISSDIRTVITKLLGLVGFDKFITVNGNDVQLKVNQEFINKIAELAKFEPIAFPYEINALVQLASYGVDFVDISMKLDNTNINLRADNFNIGLSDLTKENVLASIGNPDEYGSDVIGIVNAILSDFSAKIDLDLTSIDTTINLTNIMNNIMVLSDQSLNLPLTLDLSNYNGIFKVNFAIHQGETQLDNRLMLEVITPDGDMLISLYIYDGKTYVDLSNLGFMKFAITNADLFDFVKQQLGIASQNETQQLAMASGEIDLDNTSISATIKSELILALMRMLLFDAGVDLNVNAYINMDGELNATIDAGFISLGLDIVTAKESEDPINVDHLNKLEYPEVSALNAEAVVEGIFTAQNFDLMLDFYNNSCDTGGKNRETRIRIRKSNAQKGGVETLSNGLQAPYNSIVLAIYDNWNNLDDGNVLFWGYIDPNAAKVHIRGTRKFLQIGALGLEATGEMVDIPINNIDIKGMLVGALGGIFGESTGSNNGGIIDIPEGVLPDKKPEEDTAEDPSIKEEGMQIDSIIDGITFKMTSSLDFNVKADFNGPVLSEFLNETIQTVLTNLDLSSMTGNTDLITVNYDNVNKNVFFNDLYSKIIDPLINAQLGSTLSTILKIASFLGLDLKEDYIHPLVNRFLPLPDFDELIVDVNLTDGKLNEIKAVASNSANGQGFGADIFNRNAMDVVSWQGQDTKVYYNKNLGINPADLFVKQAKKQSNVHSNSFYENISWTVNGTPVSDWSVLDTYEDGVYNVVGSAFGKKFNVELTVENKAVQSVEDIVVKAMRDIPDYITVVFEDGSKRTLYNQTINYTRGAYDSTEAFKVLPANVVLGGNQYDFSIILENETLTTETVVVNAFDYKDVFAKMSENKLKVKVNNSFYRYVDAKYDFSQFDALSREQLMLGGEYDVPVTIGKGSDIEQTSTIKVKFTPFEVYGIEINGKSYVDTDVYDYLAGKAFPETVTVVGFDGEKQVRYEAKAIWDTTNVVMDKKGGQYIASVTLNQGSYNEWYIPAVGVVVNSADLNGLVNDTIYIDTMYAFYGGVTFDRLIPDYLDFYTTDGEIKERVPVSIDTSSITPTIKGGSYVCNVVVGEGDYKYETTVNVVLNDATMSLVEKEISFTYEEYIATNGSVLDYRMAIMLGDKQVMAKVTWFTDNVVFDTPGRYTAYVIIDEGGEYEQKCEITVEILASEEV